APGFWLLTCDDCPRVRPGRRLAPGLIGLLPVDLPAVGRTDAVDGRGTGDLRGGSGIEHHQRLAATAGFIDGAAPDAAVGADRLVGLPEMVLAAVLDRPHRLAGPLIVHVDVGAHAGEGRLFLLVRIETVIVALVLARDVIRQLVELETLTPHLIPVHRRAEAGEDGVPIVPI